MTIDKKQYEIIFLFLQKTVKNTNIEIKRYINKYFDKKPKAEKIPNKIQSELDPDDCPIRTALVTARSAPSHKRVIETLRDWGVRIDESLFLGGMDKGEFLSSFNADIFFDDQHKNIEEASDKVAAGHVLYGVKNK